MIEPNFQRIEQRIVIKILQSLKKSDIINIFDNSTAGLRITIHDLYKEFAKWYVLDGEGSRWCVYYIAPTRSVREGRELGCVSDMVSTDSLPYVLKRTSPSGYDVQRIRLGNLEHATFLPKKIQEWCNVVVLQIYECSNLRVLDLYGLSCLHHLELDSLPELESLHFAKVQPHSMMGTNDRLESLQHVVLRGLSSLKRLPDFSLCTLLKTFQMLDCEKFLPEPPWFMDCSQLEYSNLVWNGQWRLEKFKLITLTLLTSLQVCNVVVLMIYGCSNLRVLDLYGLSCLRHLELNSLPELESIHFAKVQPHSMMGTNDRLESLQHVVLRGLSSLKRLPDFSLCTLLKTFEMSNCEKFLPEPPWFMDCLQLEYSNLVWNGQWRLEKFRLDALTLLTSLQVCNVVELVIYGCSNLRVLDLYGLNCLRCLELIELPELESFHFAKVQPHSMMGTNDRLESLQHVVLRGLSSLKQLPDFSLCTLLKTFQIINCKKFLLEPSWFMGCSQLKHLSLDWNKPWQVEELRLDTLIALTSLELCNQVGISKWSRSLALKTIGSLSLTGLGNCSQLENLRLVGLPITGLQGLEKLKKLQEIYVSHCRFLQYIPDISALAELQRFTMVIGPNQEFPEEERLLQLRYLGCKVLKVKPSGQSSSYYGFDWS